MINNIEDDMLDIEDIICTCSPGPWYGSLSYDGTEFVICKEFLHDVIVKYNSTEMTEEQYSNLSLMAMSREYFPKLIQEIRRLKEQNKELKKDIEALEDALREAEYTNWDANWIV